MEDENKPKKKKLSIREILLIVSNVVAFAYNLITYCVVLARSGEVLQLQPLLLQCGFTFCTLFLYFLAVITHVVVSRYGDDHENDDEKKS